MTTIEIFADDQNLIVAEKPKIASGDKNSVRIHVDFNSEWDEYVKTGVFFNDKNMVYEQLIENDECVIPHEVLAQASLLYIGIRGVNSDSSKIKTSALIEYLIVNGAPKGNAESVPPTSDVYDQLLAAYNSALRAIEKYKTDLSSENEKFKTEVNSNIDNKFQNYQTSMNNTYNDFISQIHSDMVDFEDEVNSANKAFENTINNNVKKYMEDSNNAIWSYKNQTDSAINSFKADVNTRIKRATYILSQASEPGSDDQIVGDYWFKTTDIEDTQSESEVTTDG